MRIILLYCLFCFCADALIKQSVRLLCSSLFLLERFQAEACAGIKACAGLIKDIKDKGDKGKVKDLGSSKAEGGGSSSSSSAASGATVPTLTGGMQLPAGVNMQDMLNMIGKLVLQEHGSIPSLVPSLVCY